MICPCHFYTIFILFFCVKYFIGNQINNRIVCNVGFNNAKKKVNIIRFDKKKSNNLNEGKESGKERN